MTGLRSKLEAGSGNSAALDTRGWPHALSDEKILARPLALNLERANA